MTLGLLVWLAFLPGTSLGASAEPGTNDAEKAAVLAAREALSAAGVAAEATLRGVRPVSWPDQRLGCPGEEPKDPVPARGHRVVLDAEGTVYRVHVSEGRAVLCGKPLRPANAPRAAEEPLPDGGPVDLSDPSLEAARKDLARRLSLPLGGIELIERSEVTWPDSSLGCPQPGLSYMQVLTPGYRIRLRAGGRVYSYHGASGAPPLYCPATAP